MSLSKYDRIKILDLLIQDLETNGWAVGVTFATSGTYPTTYPRCITGACMSSVMGVDAYEYLTKFPYFRGQEDKAWHLLQDVLELDGRGSLYENSVTYWNDDFTAGFDRDVWNGFPAETKTGMFIQELKNRRNRIANPIGPDVVP